MYTIVEALTADAPHISSVVLQDNYILFYKLIDYFRTDFATSFTADSSINEMCLDDPGS